MKSVLVAGLWSGSSLLNGKSFFLLFKGCIAQTVRPEFMSGCTTRAHSASGGLLLVPETFRSMCPPVKAVWSCLLKLIIEMSCTSMHLRCSELFYSFKPFKHTNSCLTLQLFLCIIYQFQGIRRPEITCPDAQLSVSIGPKTSMQDSDSGTVIGLLCEVGVRGTCHVQGSRVLAREKKTSNWRLRTNSQKMFTEVISQQNSVPLSLTSRPLHILL